MSEHTWVMENVASYLAGGLEGTERDRLEQHRAVCPDCAAALAETRGLEQQLAALFVHHQPTPAMEDRMVQALRTQAPRRPSVWRRYPRLARSGLAAAAVLLLGVFGAAISQVMESHLLEPMFSQNNLKQVRMASTGHGGRSVDGENLSRLEVIASSVVSAYKLGTDFLNGTAVADPLLLDDSDSMARQFQFDADIKLGGRSDVAGKVSDGLDINGVDFFSHKPPPGEPDAGVSKSPQMGELSDRLGRAKPPSPSSPAGGGGWSFGRSGAAKHDPADPLNAPAPSDWSARTGLGLQNLGAKVVDAAKSRPNSSDGEKLSEALKADGKASGLSRQDYFQPGTTLGFGIEVPLPKDKDIEGGDKRNLKGAQPKDQALAGIQPSNQPPAEQDAAQKAEPAVVGKEPALPALNTRKIIRTGDIEFEIESFDAAVEQITKLVNATKGFIATVNSEKLPNGKVRGSVVLRVPPEQLDALVLDLRKKLGEMGELKSQRIGSQDITKQYTDLESRLRAARTMEERILKIIKDGKGEIKDLVAAEKELGVWRTKIEEFEGELRYYGNQVSLSTLTVILAEKEIRSAAVIVESERVNAGLEVEDVAKTRELVLKIVEEQKGRVTRSELKQHTAGQFNALLQFEVPHESAGLVRDQLKQLGTVARLEIDRVQSTEGGGPAPKDGKIKRGPTQFFVSLYNLANVTPRETVTLVVAVPDVAAAYDSLREAVVKVDGRVKHVQLNEQDRQNPTAQVHFDIRRTDEGPLVLSLTDKGMLLGRHVSRAAEGENVTDAKVKYQVELILATNIPPRETTTLAIEVSNVESTLAMLAAQVKEAKGRVVEGPNIVQDRDGRIVAPVKYQVPLDQAAGFIEKIKSAGNVRVHKVTPDPRAPEGKLALARIDVMLANRLLVPQDEGFLAQLRHGLSLSVRGLSLSASFLVVGVLFVLPWVLIIWAGFWLVRRWRGYAAAAPRT